jgi:hypothetical protein
VVITVIVETPDRIEGQSEYSTLSALGSEVASCASVFYWPSEQRRAHEGGKLGILHVKCAVADGRLLFLSSANLLMDSSVIAAYYVPECALRFKHLSQRAQVLVDSCRFDNSCHRLLIPNFCIAEVFSIFAGKAAAADGTATDVWAAVDDAETNMLVAAVEDSLSEARAARELTELGGREFSAKELDDLGMHGLHPSYSRRFPKRVKSAFLKKLLPADEHNGRTLTARLIIRTLRSARGLDTQSLRDVWHTGLLR